MAKYDELQALVDRVADEVVKRLLPHLGREAAGGPEYLTLREVAGLTGFGYDYVYDAACRGDLPATKKGRVWRVKAADARAWMDRDRGGKPLPSRSELERQGQPAAAGAEEVNASATRRPASATATWAGWTYRAVVRGSECPATSISVACETVGSAPARVRNVCRFV